MLIGTRRTLLGGAVVPFEPTDIPQSEADALIAFYHRTAGSKWTNNSGWLSDSAVNNWHGITVAGGHVTEIDLNTNNLVGRAGSTLAPLASSLTDLQVHGNSLTSLDVGALIKLGVFKCQDNAMLEGGVDTTVKAIYDNWAAYTDASPTLDISGSNEAPSGTYRDGDPPTSGKEYIFVIETDPRGTGYEVWVVTYTA